MFSGARHFATYVNGTGGTTLFAHGDWLGTERMRTNISGANAEMFTSLPFGDALNQAGSSPVHLTSKERDAETGLDNFGKRYYGSLVGRFMSVDPHDVVSDARNANKFRSDLLDSQGWNRYAYVTNNPLKFADWEGLEKYLVVYVQQPVPGTATTWTRQGIGANTGHAFIGLKDTTAHTETKAGFYPKETVTPLSPATTGVVKDDTNHSWNVKQEYKITDDQYNAVQQSISNDKADTNLQYDLNTNNCTDWVMDTAGQAGVTLPDATGTWPGGGGESPGPLGQELATQPGATVQQQNGNGSSGSSSDSSANTNDQKTLKTIKRCPVKQLLVLVVIVIIASAQTESPGRHCVLVAGVGCGNLVVHKTKRGEFLGDAQTEKRFASEGLNFSFGPDDVLDTIVATGKLFKTNLGIHPGDEEKQVRQVYGTATVAKGTLRKGEVTIGTLGDRVLCYPGIRFVIVKGRVWAIEIVPASDSKS